MPRGKCFFDGRDFSRKKVSRANPPHQTPDESSDNRTASSFDGHADETLCGRAACLLGGGSKTLGAQPVDGGFHVAIGFRKRLLAVHHPGAGALTEFLHSRGRNLSHVTNSL